MERASALIVAWDGIVADNRAVIREMTQQAFQRLGLTFEHRDDDPGQPLRSLVAAAVAREGTCVTIEQFRRAEAHFGDAYATALRGGRMVIHGDIILALDALRANGVAIALTTPHAVDLAALICPTMERLCTIASAIVGGNDVGHCDPLHMRFVIAARRCDVEPSACCAVDVLPSGIRAIVAAGMCPIGIKTTPDSAIELGEVGATRTFITRTELTPAVLHDVYYAWCRGAVASRFGTRSHRWSAALRDADDPGIP
ncbi:hypothetical protein HY480_02485 [Candidatus Uhrbacteria bacterium]|nr:hypothetical protein [Candidatus Uhrbacteria bacterium]